MPNSKKSPDVNVKTIRTASLLIQRHGMAALAFAEAQAGRLTTEGHSSSAAEWRAVAAAVRHVTSAKSPG